MGSAHAVLTQRDTAILRWLGHHGVVSIAQIWTTFFLPDAASGTMETSSVYRRIRVLEEMGLIRREQTHWRGPDVLLLTPRGAKVAACGVRAARFVPAEVAHSLAVVDLTTCLLRENPGAALVTERQMRAWQMRGRQSSSHTSDPLSPHADGVDAPPIPHLSRIPDAVLLLARREVIAVELDFTPKRRVDVVRIANAYLDHYARILRSADAPEVRWEAIAASGTFITRVWWYARAGRTASRVRETIDQEGFASFVEVRDWAETPWTTG